MSPDPVAPDLVSIRLEPLAVEFNVPRGGSLVTGLAAHGFEFPCGGIGECGGCDARILSGSLPITDSDRSIFTPDQLACGWRLACRARAESPLVLECAQWRMEVLVDNNNGRPISPASSAGMVGTHSSASAAAPSSFAALSRKGVGETAARKSAFGIAIDLGTTTIAAQLIDLATGNALAVETMLNPQAAFGADVMSRIRAALEGHDLATPIRSALGQLVARLASGRLSQIAEILLVGNTVMHHLFSGLSVRPLAHVPFQSPNLAEQRFAPRDLAWDLPDDCTIRFVRCIGGFVGSDILAGIVATGIAHSIDLAALVDLGTNGEIAIGNRDGIVCASSAAGPAFEAGSIRMGMRAVTGAISYVALREGGLNVTIIGDVSPRGICGSGVVAAVAAGLCSGAIRSNGRIANGTKTFPIAPPVVLCQSDIRELQLAKAAIAAGFRLLLKHLAITDRENPGISREKSAGLNQYTNRSEKNKGDSAPEVPCYPYSVHLAGAFGNYMHIESALRIGLFEAPRSTIHAAGNTALRGAKMLLLADREPPLPPIQHISLAADHAFQDEFANCMNFPAPQSA